MNISTRLNETDRDNKEKGKLALKGGQPVHEKEWPQWPRAGMMAQRAMLDVLHSGKWSISARTQRAKSYEREFGESFADFVGRQYAVPCASGSAALSIALQALDIGPGDEVIVPGLTWVACASAVTRLGAIPILVDVDSASLCISPTAVSKAISSATRAILAVHMYSSRADIPELQSLCDQHGLHLVEDASQAHGAKLGQQRVGSFGSISIFSFQQTKLLAAGEGGIALTDDIALYQRLQQLRADGRRYGSADSDQVFFDLDDVGGVFGCNYCMSEFHAAILIEGLNRLDRENIHRSAMLSKLHSGLQQIDGVDLVLDNLAPAEGATHYKLVLRFGLQTDWRIGPELLAMALSAELFLPIEPLDRPLNRNPLYTPLDSALIKRQPAGASQWNPKRFDLSQAIDAWQQCVALPHQCLLGSKDDVDAILEALFKIRQNTQQLLQLAEEKPQ